MRPAISPQKVRALYRDGKSLREVGEALGCSGERCRQILMRIGEPLRSSGGDPKKPPLIRSQWVEPVKGLPTPDIAKATLALGAAIERHHPGVFRP